MNTIPTPIASPTLAAPVPGAPTGDGELRHQAEVWVAQTFFGQMLKQMRESPFRSEMFDGGRGGQAFNQMFDGVIAQRLTRGTGRRLVDPIVRKLEAGRAYRRSSQPMPGTPRQGEPALPRPDAESTEGHDRADADPAPTDARPDAARGGAA